MNPLSNCLIDEPDGTVIASYIFAHGAGAPMDSDFMQDMAVSLCALGIRVIRFEFPYMVERRETGKRRPPNRQPELLESWRAIIAAVEQAYTDPLWIGGKSMGGRMATLLLGAAEPKLAVTGAICFGYPFHPQGKPEKLRTEHLIDMPVPILIIQGSRDALGCIDEVAGYDLSEAVVLHWLDDGDHDLKPRVKSGFTHQQHKHTAATSACQFITEVNC